MATVTDVNGEIVRRAYDAWDKDEPDVFDEVYAENVVHKNLQIGGVSELKNIMRRWFAAFPDLSHTVHAMLVEDEWVATRFTISGTHKGEWQGIKPTSTKFEFEGMAMERVEDGKIVERWLVEDILGFYQQLGAVLQLPSNNSA
jgi:steroid delta-isomerase-like uncharacterized protein